MINLAGVQSCDKVILDELTIAKVPGVIRLPGRLHNEVPAGVIAHFEHGGQQYTLHRAWYYWVVNGLVLFHTAKKFYEDPEGRKNIRVAGHCACPPPEEWANWYIGGERILSLSDEVELKRLKIPTEGYTFTDCPQNVPGAVFAVEGYHIDSQLGLCRFIEILTGAGT